MMEVNRVRGDDSSDQFEQHRSSHLRAIGNRSSRALRMPPAPCAAVSSGVSQPQGTQSVSCAVGAGVASDQAAQVSVEREWGIPQIAYRVVPGAGSELLILSACACDLAAHVLVTLQSMCMRPSAWSLACQASESRRLSPLHGSCKQAGECSFTAWSLAAASRIDTHARDSTSSI